MDEKRIAELMRSLDLTRAEVIELMQEDADIDRMDLKDVNNDLTADQKKVVKKMKQADRKPTAYNWSQRERKINEPKRHLIHLLEIAIGYNADVTDFEITNPERQIDFKYNGTRYRIVLSAPRK